MARWPSYGVNLVRGHINDDMIRHASSTGALPVKVTDPSPKFRQKTGEVTITVVLPADPQRAWVSLYTVQVTPGAGIASFPSGGSPLVRSATGTINARTPLGSTCDAWVVTEDKFFNPTSPTSTNAYYIGRFTNTAGVVSSGVNV